MPQIIADHAIADGQILLDVRLSTINMPSVLQGKKCRAKIDTGAAIHKEATEEPVGLVLPWAWWQSFSGFLVPTLGRVLYTLPDGRDGIQAAPYQFEFQILGVEVPHFWWTLG